MPRPSSFRHGERENAINKVDLIPLEMELFCPSQPRLHGKGDELPILRSHHASMSFEFGLGQKPRSSNFWEKLYARYGILYQPVVFHC